MSPVSPRPTLTPELIARYDRPGPRYTSYPTALEFSEAYGPDDYERDLAAANAESDAPLSLYFHLPFCEARCSFCACNVIITPHHHTSEPYLERLKRELDLAASRLPDRRKVAQLHYGGGTPTYQSPAELRALYGAIESHFEILSEAEVAIEVDPRVTTAEHMITLRDLGFNRLSLGVQDFDAAVQEAVARRQTVEQTERIFDQARDLGFSSLNIDLIYGLPRQTVATFEHTLEQAIALKPDRVALYSFALVPWIRKNQDLIDQKELPPADVKIELFVMAVERFLAAGYRKIGMDHFALPEDDLGLAQSNRRLYRNFMGYTVRPTNATVALGVSAIGEMQGARMQNTKKLNRYYEAIDSGRFAIERGFRATADDLLRADIIQSVMCNFYVDFAELEAKHGIDYYEYFAAEQPELDDLEAGELIRREGKTLTVTPLGQFFVRNVAMVFDAYLKAKQAGRPMFSRTV